MPEHQQLGILRQITAEHEADQAEYLARKRIDDLEQHPASQPSPHHARWRKRRSVPQSIIQAVQVVAESLLDRLINNSHQAFMNGPSYRPNKSPSRVVPTGKTSAS
jgi:hypothetical protein